MGPFGRAAPLHRLRGGRSSGAGSGVQEQGLARFVAIRIIVATNHCDPYGGAPFGAVGHPTTRSFGV
eukprot:12302875-Alexandrium_andersonii.AAC.1